MGLQEGKEYKTLFRSPLSSPCCHELRPPPPHFPAPTPKQPPVLTASSKGTKTISSVPTDTHLAMAQYPSGPAMPTAPQGTTGTGGVRLSTGLVLSWRGSTARVSPLPHSSHLGLPSRSP